MKYLITGLGNIDILPLVGVQFHPEFTPERLQRNWIERRERLRGTTSLDLDAALDLARPTPHTASRGWPR